MGRIPISVVNFKESAQYHDDVADQLDFYEEHDEAVFLAFDEILELLEKRPNDEPTTAETIRPANAFVVQVYRTPR